MHKMGKWHQLDKIAERNDEMISRLWKVTGTELNEDPIRHKFCQINISMLSAMSAKRSCDDEIRQYTGGKNFKVNVILKYLFFSFSSSEISLN